MNYYYDTTYLFTEKDIYDYFEKIMDLEPLSKIYTKTQTGKSNERTIIQALNQYSDIAKYVAIGLVKYATKWSIEDALNEIQNPTIIPNEYRKYLQKCGDQNLSDTQKRKIAITIIEETIANERNALDTLHKTLDTDIKYPFAGEISNKLIDISNTIIEAIQFITKLGKYIPKYNTLLKQTIMHNPNSQITTSTYINTLVGNINPEKSLTNILSLSLNDFEYSKSLKEYVDDLIQRLENIPYVLYPESKFPITDISSLKKYFSYLLTDKEIKRAQNILKNYKRI